MADRPRGIGRGGRGAALKQLFSQQEVRNPGDVQPTSSQQSQQPSGPAPQGQVHSEAQAAGAQAEASVPLSSAQQATAQPSQGRGAMLQRVYEVQMAQQQQQQPASLSATPERPEASVETGNSHYIHCYRFVSCHICSPSFFGTVVNV